MTRFAPAPVSTAADCRCCAGDTVIYGDPCPGCVTALTSGPDGDHPHPLSHAQVAARAASRAAGRSPGREVVDVTVAHHRDGTRTVLDVDEASRRQVEEFG